MKSLSDRLHKQEGVALRLTFFLLFLFTALSFGSFSCQKDQGGNNDFLIPIDSIRVPSELKQGESFNIQFYGVIGFSDCYSFKTFNRTLRGNIMTIECYGTFTDNKGKCTDRLVTMDGIFMNMTINVPGIYSIMVKEPGSFTLVEQIEIK